MVACGAHGCTKRSEKCCNLSFFSFPFESKKELSPKWLNQIKQQNIPKNLFICSSHFEQEMLERDLKVRNSFYLSYSPKKCYPLNSIKRKYL